MGVPAVGEALKLALAGFVALVVAMGIGRFAFTPLLPLMQADAGLSLTAGAWLALANYVGYFAGALSARRFGSLRGGLATIAVTTLAMGFAQPLPLWALWRMLAGAASAWVLVQVSARCIRRETAGTARGGVDAGIVFAGVGAGSALAGLVCLPVASASQGWLVLGAIACVALVMPMPAPSEARAAPAPPVWQHAALIAAYGAYGFGYILPATFIPTMARELIADPAVFGWAWPIFGTAAALSTLAANPMIARVGARRVWLVAQVVMAVGVVAPLVLPGYSGIVVAALAVGATFVVVTLAAMREAVYLSARPAGLMAAMTAAFAAGQIAGPLVVAVGLSISAALALGAGLLLVGAAALVRPEHRRPAAE